MKRRIWLNLLVLSAGALYIFHKTKVPDSWVLIGALFFAQLVLFCVCEVYAGRKAAGIARDNLSKLQRLAQKTGWSKMEWGVVAREIRVTADKVRSTLRKEFLSPAHINTTTAEIHELEKKAFTAFGKSVIYTSRMNKASSIEAIRALMEIYRCSNGSVEFF